MGVVFRGGHMGPTITWKVKVVLREIDAFILRAEEPFGKY